MSKFNLSSVYTNDNIYSVLKLLKALIDTLDNYEFQDPIVDANGNQIPMTWFQKLYKSINGTDDGSVAVGKDANVAGSLNVDLSALINGTIRLAKNKLGLKQGADEKIYFSNVTLKYKDNTEYPGIVILYSYQYAALVIDVNNSVLHFLSSPLSTISETNTGFEITTQPLGNVKINCYDLMTLPSRVNDLEGQVTNAETNASTARTEASNALAKTNTLEADVAELKTNKQNKLYIHTITITGSGQSPSGAPINCRISFTATLTKNTPIDSVQALTANLNSHSYACSGVYDGMGKSLGGVIYKIDIGSSDANTTIYQGVSSISLSSLPSITIADIVFTAA